MTRAAEPQAAREWDQAQQLRDFVCVACGCVCDDLTLTVEGRRITSVEPPCPLAATFFQMDRPAPQAASLVAGQPAPFEDALSRAARILNESRAPLVMGLERATTDAQRAAVALADRLGAVIDPTDYQGHSRSHAAVQTFGAVTATLGEVAARADVVVYWNVDPLESHPRHVERFARRPLSARGTHGLQRRVIAVGSQRTKTSQSSDEFLPISQGGEQAALAVLRSLLRGVAVDETTASSQTGALVEQWAYLAQRLKMARYVAIFHPLPAPAAVTELVRELHQHTRAAALPLGAPPNAAGATQVLTWQTGFPAAVDFAAGYPAHLPDEASAARLLERGEVDAALIIACDPLDHYADAALARLTAIPTIVLDDRESKTAAAAEVSFFTPVFGIETEGEIYRSDGLALPLRAVVSSPLPTAGQILGELLTRLD